MISLIIFSSIYLIVAIFVVARCRTYGVSGIAIFSCTVRYFACVAALNVDLPFSGVDSITFIRIGENWSRLSFLEILGTFDTSKSFIYSSILALLFNVSEEKMVVAIFLNGILGVLIFYLAVVLVNNLWNSRASTRTIALIVAIHPILILNSAVTIRENFIIVFALLSSLFLIEYYRKRIAVNLIWFALFAGISTCFHGGMAVFLVGAPLGILIVDREQSAIRKVSLGAVFLMVGLFAIQNISIGKFSRFEDGIDIDKMQDLENSRQLAGTSYLQGMQINTAVDVVWQTPIRFFYLITKPFPSDIRGMSELLVFVDSLLWWACIYMFFRNYKFLIKNKPAIALLICTVLGLVAFSYGTSNYGTGIRHRTKFLIFVIAILAPFFSKTTTKTIAQKYILLKK